MLGQIISQVFRHALGQRGHQRALVGPDPQIDLGQQIVDLGIDRPYFDLGINQTGGARHLFHDPAGMSFFIRAGRGRDKQGLRDQFFKFVKAQRPVIQRGRQPETIFDQILLAGAIAAIHAAELRHGDMAFVDDHQRVFGQVIQQGRRRLAGGPA